MVVYSSTLWPEAQVSFSDPFTIGALAVFGVVFVGTVGIYALADRLPGWDKFRARATRRYALPAATLSALGLIDVGVGLTGNATDLVPVVAYVLFVALVTMAGYATYYFIRVYPGQAAEWRAEEVRKQYFSRPQGTGRSPHEQQEEGSAKALSFP